MRSQVGQRAGGIPGASSAPCCRGAADELLPRAGRAGRRCWPAGKRLRPAFCYWGWRGAGGRGLPGDLLAAAAALELLHAGALVHDDVMDGSDTRRGQPALHRRFAARHAARRLARLAGGVRHRGRRSCSATCCWPGPTSCSRPAGCRRRAAPGAGRCSTDAHRGDGRPVPGPARPGRGDGSVASALRVVGYKTAKYTIERPLHLGAALAGPGRPGPASPRPTPATACRSAWRSSSGTTSSACSATRPRPASRPATTCARASGPCCWPSPGPGPAPGQAAILDRLPRRPRAGRGGGGRGARRDHRHRRAGRVRAADRPSPGPGARRAGRAPSPPRPGRRWPSWPCRDRPARLTGQRHGRARLRPEGRARCPPPRVIREPGGGTGHG